MEGQLGSAWGEALAQWKEQSRNTPNTRSLTLSDDRLKSKLIGREGRNVAAFEESAGCDLLVDQTPREAQVVSYSPERRLLGELTLVNLILEDRIHPDRIREWAGECETMLGRSEILRAIGREAVVIVGGSTLTPEQCEGVGKLFAKVEAGQPILGAAIEAAHLAASLLQALGHPAEQAASLALLAYLSVGCASCLGQEEQLREIREDAPTSLESAAVCAAIDAVRDRPGARRDGLAPHARFVEEILQSPTIRQAWLMRRGREVWLFPTDSSLSEEEAHRQVDSARRACEYPHAVKTRVVRQPE